MRAAGRAAVLGRHPPRRPATSTSSPSTSSAELVYTNVLDCLDLAGVPGAGRGRAGPSTRSSIAGGHCAFNPEPLADFVDAFVIGDGEEAVGEITEVVGAWKRAGRTAREGVLRELATIPGVYVPVDVRRRVRRPVHRARSRPRFADVPARRRQAHGRRPRRVAVPEAAARAAHRGGARPPQRRDLPRLHARLPVLPGGDDHPAGARAARRAGAHDGAGRPAPHRLRRGRAHVAVERRLLRASTALVADLVNEQAGLRQRRRSRCRRCGSTRSPSASRARSRRSAAPGSRSRPRRARGGCAR